MSVCYARENKVPYLGLCLGLQVAVAEFARHVAGMVGANSSEFDPSTNYPVIDLLPEQKDIADMGGTMRLGASPTKVIAGTKAYAAYGEEVIYERHRHRYEVNNIYRSKLVDAGLVIGGMTPDERLVELIELTDHPWFVACQYHPEFKSRPTKPHPLFRDFIAAAIACQCGAKAERGADGLRGKPGRGRMTGIPAPSRERLTELFLDLTRLPSPSRSERKVADAVTACLKAAGVTVHEDDTGSRIGGDTGNLWCTVRGDGTGPHLALGAHMDTVEPTDGIQPVLDDEEVFRNTRPTILGADDKAAIAALLHATELLHASR